jgi:hypothetical protein
LLGFSQMFTSLSILTILAEQFTQLFQSIPALFAALACLGRIQTFLLTPGSRNDNRMSGSLLPVICSGDFSLGGMMTDLLTASPEPGVFENRLKKFATPLPPLNERWDAVHRDAVHLKGASFAWDGSVVVGARRRKRRRCCTTSLLTCPPMLSPLSSALWPAVSRRY